MRILIAGGTGFIGRHLVKFWSQHEVSVIGRNELKIQSIFANKVKAYEWSELDFIKPQQFDIVVNLAGESINHLRWTKAIKNKIITSRVEITKKLANWCAKDPDKKIRLLSANGITIYGLQQNIASQPFTEEDEPKKSTGFIVEVAKAWEAAAMTAQAQGIQTTIMRFAVVLDAKEGALPRMLLPYRLGLGGKIGSGKQPFAWISIHDLVRAIDLVMLQSITGKINMVAPQIITQKDFAKILAGVLKRPCFLKMPAWACKVIFGQMGNELLLHGQNVYPKRLLEEGFAFSHDSLKKALLELGVK